MEGFKVQMSNNLNLSASEILNLWNVYLTETMTTHVTKYFINTTEDLGVKRMLEYALQISIEGVETSSKILKDANHPLPEGFNENDVDLNAPKICSDDLVIIIKNTIGV